MTPSDADILAELELVREHGGFQSLMFPTDKAAIAFARAVLALRVEPSCSLHPTAWPACAPAAMTPAAWSVLAERQRQVTVEGFTPHRDDTLVHEELRKGAIAYASHGGDPYLMPRQWPWPSTTWKPTTPRQNLVKAGALLLAEIERIDRAHIRGGAHEETDDEHD